VLYAGGTEQRLARDLPDRGEPLTPSRMFAYDAMTVQQHRVMIFVAVRSLTLSSSHARRKDQSR
jgi:hypothetical protein